MYQIILISNRKKFTYNVKALSTQHAIAVAKFQHLEQTHQKGRLRSVVEHK